ncbi:TetR family transcriptional regulator [Klebsiella pneumoniae subsp. pneumoniae]|nr:TetR family transcriptional regulator [Klebsiella pneumoniae subsp. pneumoniae]
MLVASTEGEDVYGTGRGEEKAANVHKRSAPKKEAILAAALEAFSQFGIHGTRLEQVAERAGVSKTNLLLLLPFERGAVCGSPAADPSPSGWRR